MVLLGLFLLLLLSFISIFVGLINPRWVLVRSKNPTRLKALGASVGVFLVLTVIFGIFGASPPEVEGESVKVEVPPVVDNQSENTRSDQTAAPASDSTAHGASADPKFKDLSKGVRETNKNTGEPKQEPPSTSGPTDIGVTEKQVLDVFYELGIRFDKSVKAKGLVQWVGHCENPARLGEYAVDNGKPISVGIMSFVEKGNLSSATQALLGIGSVMYLVFPDWEDRGDWLLNAMKAEGGETTVNGLKVRYRFFDRTGGHLFSVSVPYEEKD